MAENNNIKMNNIFVIKVFDYVEKHISGKLYDVLQNENYSYYNMTQLILKIKDIISSNDGAELSKAEVFDSASKEGHFELVTGEKVWLPEKLRVMRTFRVRICFTRFGTWQGELWCMDTGEHTAFRSILEMILLIDAELETANAYNDLAVGGI